MGIFNKWAENTYHVAHDSDENVHNHISADEAVVGGLSPHDVISLDGPEEKGGE